MDTEIAAAKIARRLELLENRFNPQSNVLGSSTFESSDPSCSLEIPTKNASSNHSRALSNHPTLLEQVAQDHIDKIMSSRQEGSNPFIPNTQETIELLRSSDSRASNDNFQSKRSLMSNNHGTKVCKLNVTFFFFETFILTKSFSKFQRAANPHRSSAKLFPSLVLIRNLW